jgi:hypothetical protein
MGEGRKPEPQLIGGHPVSARAVGEKVQLLFLDAVFHIPTGTVKVIVQRPGQNDLAISSKTFCRQVGHDKTRIVALGAKSPLCR